ncbi:MAG: cytochrome b [Paracoccaceae bacterium]
MAVTNTQESWGLVTRLIHWLMAILIVFQVAGGLYMVQVIGDDLIQRFNWTQTHKSWGFVVVCLAALRIIWRALNPVPADPPMPRWQTVASRISHYAFYVLMIAIPVTGWLMASASPLNDADAYVQVKNQVTLQYLFGKDLLDLVGLKEQVLLEMPDPYEPGDEALTEILARIHLALALTLTALLGVHIAAALKHQFVDRDGLLARMVTGR